MTETIYPILAAAIINIILGVFSLLSYKRIIGTSWENFSRKLGWVIAIKFAMLMILTLVVAQVFHIANITFAISFTLFMVLQIMAEVFYLVKLSKEIKE